VPGTAPESGTLPGSLQPLPQSADGVPRPGEKIEDTPNVRKRTFTDPNNTPGASLEPTGGLPWGAIPIPIPLVPIPFRGPQVAAETGFAEPEQPNRPRPALRPAPEAPLPGRQPATVRPTGVVPAINTQGVPGTAPGSTQPPNQPPTNPAEPCNPCASLALLNAQLAALQAQLAAQRAADGVDSAGDAATQARLTAIQTQLTRMEAEQAADLGLSGIINSKLGDPVPGGISGLLGRMQSFAETAWRVTRMDKILNVLTLATSLHNAAMLSSNLGSTLSEVTGLALQVIGIKDEKDNPLDVGEIVGQTVSNLVKGIVGEEVYNGTKKAWNKLNRIVSTASQLLWTVRSIADSSKEIMEWTGENTGKIGNALKRWGVVGENAYGWMPERLNQQGRWFARVERYRSGVDNLDDAASSLQGVLSEVREIQEEAGELKEQKDNFDKAIKDALPKEREENTATKARSDTEKAASNSPDLTGVSLQKKEPEN
jgi:hypothetical protein